MNQEWEPKVGASVWASYRGGWKPATIRRVDPRFVHLLFENERKGKRPHDQVIQRFTGETSGPPPDQATRPRCPCVVALVKPKPTKEQERKP